MKKIFLIGLCLMVAFSMVYAGDYTYVGSGKCKMCHKGDKKGNVWEKWEASAHSKAFETLKKKGEEKNPKCLECHTTAFDKGGYKIGDAEAANFEGVGCESCHGAGSDYKKMSVMKDHAQSVAAGLAVPNEATCTKCHNKNSPTFKGFDFAEYSKKISHKYK